MGGMDFAASSLHPHFSSPAIPILHTSLLARLLPPASLRRPGSLASRRPASVSQKPRGTRCNPSCTPLTTARTPCPGRPISRRCVPLPTRLEFTVLDFIEPVARSKRDRLTCVILSQHATSEAPGVFPDFIGCSPLQPQSSNVYLSPFHEPGPSSPTQLGPRL